MDLKVRPPLFMRLQFKIIFSIIGCELVDFSYLWTWLLTLASVPNTDPLDQLVAENKQ